MKQKALHINYPSMEADKIGQITALIRDSFLEHFHSNQISFSFSSTKNSGYIMVYPTHPIFKLRVSNHTPVGMEVDDKVILTEGNLITINAEAPHGQIISEQVLFDTLEQIKAQCAELQTKIIKR